MKVQYIIFSPLQQQFCGEHCSLDPLETKTMRFRMCRAAPVIEKDAVLILSKLYAGSTDPAFQIPFGI